MRHLKILASLTRYSIISTLRTPRAVIFTIFMPVLLLVIFNGLYGSNSTIGTDPEIVNGLRVTATAYLTAGMIAYATALTGFTNTLTAITFQREAGQLKRLRGTPMPPWTFVAAQAIRTTLQVLTVVVVILVISTAGYGMEAKGAPYVGVAVYAILGGLSFTALGIAASSLTTGADSAGPIAALPIVLLSFVSGVFIPVSQLGSTMRQVGDIFPLAHLAKGMQAALGVGSHGLELHGKDIWPLLVWTAVGVFVAARRFRWEPRGR
jgi:ABC-2 type transport system permease protein